MTRFGAFYFSTVPGAGRTPVPIPGGGTVYVRVEVVPDVADVGEALDAVCTGLHGDEELLNTEPLPDPWTPPPPDYYRPTMTEAVVILGLWCVATLWLMHAAGAF